MSLMDFNWNEINPFLDVVGLVLWILFAYLVSNAEKVNKVKNVLG